MAPLIKDHSRFRALELLNLLPDIPCGRQSLISAPDKTLLGIDKTASVIADQARHALGLTPDIAYVASQATIFGLQARAVLRNRATPDPARSKNPAYSHIVNPKKVARVRAQQLRERYGGYRLKLS